MSLTQTYPVLAHRHYDAAQPPPKPYELDPSVQRYPGRSGLPCAVRKLRSPMRFVV